MPVTFGREKVVALMQDLLRYARADQTEISFSNQVSSLTRFANNYIHQNVQETNSTIKIRSVLGQKIGTVTGNSLDIEDLKNLLKKSEELAALQVEDPHFKSLPGPELGRVTGAIPEPDEATYYADPLVRAAAAGIICKKASEQNLIASGAFQTSGYETAVVNSRGLASYFRGASSDIVTVIMGNNSSGYAQRLSPRVSEIDGEEVADEAIGKAIRSADPKPLAPGAYEVILEEYAVNEMLNYMSYLGMGALALREGRSFMALGQQLMDQKVTIVDDGNDPRNVIMPFDAEGVARKRVTLVEKGVAKEVVYDTYNAGFFPGAASTGHSTGTQGEVGPFPGHLAFEPGAFSKDEMLKQVKRGIWVTRFHYVNPLVPDKAVLTGMTRDGTFLIENGEISYPIKNFRFTQSAVEALNSVSSIGKNLMLLPSFYAGNLVPALRVNKFTFNSATEF